MSGRYELSEEWCGLKAHVLLSGGTTGEHLVCNRAELPQEGDAGLDF